MYNSANFTVDSTRTTKNKLYYNYNGTFNQGSKATLFTNIVIPTDFTSSQISTMGTFKLVVKAEAIQSAQMSSQAVAYTTLDRG